MEKTNHSLKESIKGIIFDSGWNNLHDTILPVMKAEINSQLDQSYFKLMAHQLYYAVSLLYKCTFKKDFQKLPGLQHDIVNIKQPILFIHSTHDKYAPIQPVIELTKQCQNPHIWFNNSDAHATINLKQQNEYTRRLKSFLHQI